VWDTKRCRCARAEFGSLFSFLAEKKKLGLACGQFPPRDLCLKGPTEKTSGKVWQVGFSSEVLFDPFSAHNLFDCDKQKAALLPMARKKGHGL